MAVDAPARPPQFMGEAVAPVLVFYAAWRTAGLGPAIVASTIAYLVLAAWLLHRRRDVALVLVGAVFVVIQALVAFAAHSATVYLAQPVLLSALWGVAYVVSAAVGRPLIGLFAVAWYPFPTGSGRRRRTGASSDCSRSSGASIASHGRGCACTCCSTPASAASS